MTRDVCEVDSEREREGEKEKEREGERWSGCSLKCEKILSGVSGKNKKKNCRDNVFISAPLPM